MNSISLETLGSTQLDLARQASSGRASHTVNGGHDHVMRQTVIALTAGQQLAEHENPGEATLQVIDGHIRLIAGSDSAELTAGGYLVIPDGRHAVEAVTDSVILLTAVPRSRPA